GHLRLSLRQRADVISEHYGSLPLRRPAADGSAGRRDPEIHQTLSRRLDRSPRRAGAMDHGQRRRRVDQPEAVRRIDRQAREGLTDETPARMATAIAAGPSAVQLPDAANAVVAAQAIDENASANVARRDDVCRRRNWLRRACTRKQSWIRVAAAAAVNM